MSERLKEVEKGIKNLSHLSNLSDLSDLFSHHRKYSIVTIIFLPPPSLLSELRRIPCGRWVTSSLANPRSPGEDCSPADSLKHYAKESAGCALVVTCEARVKRKRVRRRIQSYRYGSLSGLRELCRRAQALRRIQVFPESLPVEPIEKNVKEHRPCVSPLGNK